MISEPSSCSPLMPRTFSVGQIFHGVAAKTPEKNRRIRIENNSLIEQQLAPCWAVKMQE